MGVPLWRWNTCEHALSFSDTAVSLLRREPDGRWARLDRAAIDSGHLRAAMISMRESMAARDAAVHLFLPTGHVLSAKTDAADAGDAAARLAAIAGCDPDSLATVCRRSGNGGKITAFAADRTTIGEAVAHALDWGFRPVSVGVHPDTTPGDRPIRFPADLPHAPHRPVVIGAAAATVLLTVGLAATLALRTGPPDQPAPGTELASAVPPAAERQIPAMQPTAAPAPLSVVQTPLPARPVTAPVVTAEAPRAATRPAADPRAPEPTVSALAPAVLRSDARDVALAPQGTVRLAAVTRQMPPQALTPRSGPAPAVLSLPPLAPEPPSAAATAANAQPDEAQPDGAPAAAVPTGNPPQAETPAPASPPDAPEPPAAAVPAPDAAPAAPPAIAGPAGIRPTRKPDDIPQPVVAAVTANLPSPMPVSRPALRAQTVAAPAVAVTRGASAPAAVASSATLSRALPEGQALLGIIARDGRREALLRTADGNIARVTQGDSVGPWRVSAINERSIRLVGSGGKETLSLPGG